MARTSNPIPKDRCGDLGFDVRKEVFEKKGSPMAQHSILFSADDLTVPPVGGELIRRLNFMHGLRSVGTFSATQKSALLRQGEKTTSLRQRRYGHHKRRAQTLDTHDRSHRHPGIALRGGLRLLRPEVQRFILRENSTSHSLGDRAQPDCSVDLLKAHCGAWRFMAPNTLYCAKGSLCSRDLAECLGKSRVIA